MAKKRYFIFVLPLALLVIPFLLQQKTLVLKCQTKDCILNASFKDYKKIKLITLNCTVEIIRDSSIAKISYFCKNRKGHISVRNDEGFIKQIIYSFEYIK